MVGGCSDLGQGPKSGAVEVDVTCDPPDWSYSYSSLNVSCNGYAKMGRVSPTMVCTVYCFALAYRYRN